MNYIHVGYSCVCCQSALISDLLAARTGIKRIHVYILLYCSYIIKYLLILGIFDVSNVFAHRQGERVLNEFKGYIEWVLKYEIYSQKGLIILYIWYNVLNII